MEKSRSWPSAHDWKSCIPQKGIEGSNPSFSAKKKTRYSFRIPGFFCVYGMFPGLKVGNIRIAILASKVFPLGVPLID